MLNYQRVVSVIWLVVSTQICVTKHVHAGCKFIAFLPKEKAMGPQQVFLKTTLYHWAQPRTVNSSSTNPCAAFSVVPWYGLIQDYQWTHRCVRLPYGNLPLTDPFPSYKPPFSLGMFHCYVWLPEGTLRAKWTKRSWENQRFKSIQVDRFPAKKHGFSWLFHIFWFISPRVSAFPREPPWEHNRRAPAMVPMPSVFCQAGVGRPTHKKRAEQRRKSLT